MCEASKELRQISPNVLNETNSSVNSEENDMRVSNHFEVNVQSTILQSDNSIRQMNQKNHSIQYTLYSTNLKTEGPPDTHTYPITRFRHEFVYDIMLVLPQHLSKSKRHLLAERIEKVLYKQSSTFDEYSDISTLRQRVSKLASNELKYRQSTSSNIRCNSPTSAPIDNHNLVTKNHNSNQTFAVIATTSTIHNTCPSNKIKLQEDASTIPIAAVVNDSENTSSKSSYNKCVIRLSGTNATTTSTATATTSDSSLESSFKAHSSDTMIINKDLFSALSNID